MAGDPPSSKTVPEDAAAEGLELAVCSSKKMSLIAVSALLSSKAPATDASYIPQRHCDPATKGLHHPLKLIMLFPYKPSLRQLLWHKGLMDLPE